ncbi:TIGR03943 family protein [Shimazuella sp. AN120528]|uniref:TIGR03943 family putative permease subunit n=1 Tax=Shimazuella soli TaxID=1892854 RepID=UPI001F0EE2F2|nr:TIGR03943 family protein [Shimazuella soli]MCH5584806.1 TIGR03943 family protein [Shimazuella soli]
MAVLFRITILFGFALVLSYLIISHDLDYFINPRLQYLSVISVLFLLTLGLVQLKNVGKRAAHPVGVWGYLMVCLPICFFLLFPSKPAETSLADNKMYTYVPNQVKKTNPSPNQSTDAPQELTEEEWELPYKKKAAELKKLPVIILTSENYIDISNVLMMYPEQFIGKKIRTIGFVYREEGFKADQFVIARLAITCCVADAGVVGFLLDTPESNLFKNDQWFQIDGTFGLKKNESGDVPGLKMKSYKKVPALKDSYVYQQF